jgi:hypothetical protein
MLQHLFDNSLTAPPEALLNSTGQGEFRTFSQAEFLIAPWTLELASMCVRACVPRVATAAAPLLRLRLLLRLLFADIRAQYCGCGACARAIPCARSRGPPLPCSHGARQSDGLCSPGILIWLLFLCDVGVVRPSVMGSF